VNVLSFIVRVTDELEYYGDMHNSQTHYKKVVPLNGATCNIPIKIETLQVYFAYLIYALCVCPLCYGRRQVNNPFPPIPVATSHHRFLRYTGSRHGIFHAIALCCSSPADSFRTWFENVAAPSRSTMFGRTQARKIPSLPASPFSLNQHPWRPPTQLSTRGTYKLVEFLFLSVCRVLP
jgi:hypothetical protein